VKVKAWGLLLLVAAFGGIIIYNLKTGIAYSRGGVIYEATDPAAFWMAVYGAGLMMLLVLLAFFVAQVGDGWNDDG